MRNKKIAVITVVAIGIAIIWLWFRKNPQAVQYIQKAANDLGLPKLVAPIINSGDAPNYAIPLAQFPGTPTIDMGNGCCPTCERKGMSFPPSEPVSIAPPTPQTYEHLVYQTQYVTQTPVTWYITASNPG